MFSQEDVQGEDLGEAFVSNPFEILMYAAICCRVLSDDLSDPIGSGLVFEGFNWRLNCLSGEQSRLQIDAKIIFVLKSNAWD